MPNKRNNRKVQLGARVSEELKDQLEETAKSLGKTLTDFVEEVLSERIQDHKEDLENIVELRKSISARERATPKRWR